MQGRIVVYFSLGFVLGAVFCGIALFLRQNAFTTVFLPAASGVGAIVCTVFILKKRSLVWALTAAFFCGCLACCAGGIPRDSFGFLARAENIKIQFSEYLDGFFAEEGVGAAEQTAVLKALTIGDKDDLDRALKEDYRQSGAMHLLALSGLHIGLIYAFLSLLLSFLGRSPASRLIRKILILGALWGYAVITGLSNSISRAVIMITVYELTELFSSRKDLLRALAISALITTLFNPAAPFQIGFQLSYSAVTAICFLYPRMKGLLRARSALMGYIWNGLSLSICCQAATAPLAYLYFGTFPRYFMITNLAAIPITGIVMYTIPVALCLKPLRPVLFWSLSLLNRLIHTVAGMGT